MKTGITLCLQIHGAVCNFSGWTDFVNILYHCYCDHRIVIMCFFLFFSSFFFFFFHESVCLLLMHKPAPSVALGTVSVFMQKVSLSCSCSILKIAEYSLFHYLP